MALTSKQKLLIEQIALGDSRLTAMHKAGYSTASPSSAMSACSKILKKKESQEYLASIRKDVKRDIEIEVEDVVALHWEWANYNPKDFFDFSGEHGVMLKPDKEIPHWAWKAVASVKNTRYGLEIKFVDKQRSLIEVSELLGFKKTAGEAIDNGMGQLFEILERAAAKETARGWLPEKK
jgi:thymidylate synthase ThyX